jgi:hypothetical protein
MNKAYPDSKLRDKLLPTLRDTYFRKLFGRRVVDEIYDRTVNKNIDKDNNTFAPYSTGYINSLRFKIYSKSSGDVNLRLTGEMMASLNPVDSPNTVVIEVLGENNKAKADGHITGRRGKSVTRDFLGLPEDVEVNLFKDTLKKYRQGSLYLLSDILT